MAEPRYPCGSCGTWTCYRCGHARPSTGVQYCVYPCGRCRGLTGVLSPAMHTRRMWDRHNRGALPEPMAYGERPAPEDWGEGFGPRTVLPVTYRGVPYPDRPVDIESFKLGVDATLAVMRSEGP